MTTNGSPPASEPTGEVKPRTLPGAGIALLLLLAINMFNYLDRQVLAAVEPRIAADLGLDEFWSGTLNFAFLVTYMLTAPIFGWLADRMSRWVLVGFGVVLWSLASGASGIDWISFISANLSAAFWLLFLTRCFVGVGEAAYGPAAPAILSDMYPVEQRGKIMALFYLAIPVGGALGYTLGGVVINVFQWDWHWAFFLVVPPGIFLGVWAFLMREPPRGKTETVTVTENVVRHVGWRDYVDLLKIPSYSINLVGMTCMTFSIGGIAYFMARYLESRGVTFAEIFGLRIDALTFFGGIIATAGLAATVLGGIAGDRLRNRVRGSYFVVSGISMTLGFPMVLGVLWTPFPWAWIFIFLAVFTLFFNTAPTNAINANVTHPSVRASAFALNILIIHLFGDAISPAIIGLVAMQAGNLDAGFILVSVMMLVGGLFWIWGSFYLNRDTELAPTRLRHDGN